MMDATEGEEKLKEEIQRYQFRVSKRPHEKLVLHPQQLVLGATLEYLSFPDCIGGYVLSRSSWGRLGLIIATATFVNPGFKGCLTLELLNLGEVPLVLYPGIRVAQLVLHKVYGKPGMHESRYRCPTEPEFSRVYQDEELQFWGEPKIARITVSATFSAGVLRPGAKLPLEEGEEVEVEIRREKPPSKIIKITVCATFSAGLLRPDAEVPLAEDEEVEVDIRRRKLPL
jgi:deoxycytidine triphosphate deaminase